MDLRSNLVEHFQIFINCANPFPWSYTSFQLIPDLIYSHLCFWIDLQHFKGTSDAKALFCNQSVNFVSDLSLTSLFQNGRFVIQNSLVEINFLSPNSQIPYWSLSRAWVSLSNDESQMSSNSEQWHLFGFCRRYFGCLSRQSEREVIERLFFAFEHLIAHVYFNIPQFFVSFALQN